MRAMSASRLMSVEGGRASQPDAGAARPQMFRNRTINRVVSKTADETEDGMAGKSLPHCVGLIIFLPFSVNNEALFAARTACIFAGKWMVLNWSLSAWVPISTNRRHNRA